jgi:hypothetical protein
VKVALVLGPGWSRAAGYPDDLLSGPVYAASEDSRTRVQTVLDAYRGPDHQTFLRAVRAGTVQPAPDPDELSLFDRPLPYAWAIEAIALKLLRPDGRGRREARLLPTRADFRTRDGGHLEPAGGTQAHRALLAQLDAGHELIGVVTTTYDTLIEGLLHGRFHYGGLPRPQHAVGAGSWEYYNDPRPEERALELDGEIPVCKLNGSVNWEGSTIWRDMRLPSRDPARAALDVRLPQVRAAAQELLDAADRLILVGTDAPPLPTTTPHRVHELPEREWARRFLRERAEALREGRVEPIPPLA